MDDTTEKWIAEVRDRRARYERGERVNPAPKPRRTPIKAGPPPQSPNRYQPRIIASTDRNGRGYSRIYVNGPLDFSDPECAAAQVKYGDATLGYAMFATQGLERLRTSENQTHRNAYRAITAVVATIVALIVLFVVAVFVVSLIINC